MGAGDVVLNETTPIQLVISTNSLFIVSVTTVIFVYCMNAFSYFLHEWIDLKLQLRYEREKNGRQHTVDSGHS